MDSMEYRAILETNLVPYFDGNSSKNVFFDKIIFGTIKETYFLKVLGNFHPSMTLNKAILLTINWNLLLWPYKTTIIRTLLCIFQR